MITGGVSVSGTGLVLESSPEPIRVETDVVLSMREVSDSQSNPEFRIRDLVLESDLEVPTWDGVPLLVHGPFGLQPAPGWSWMVERVSRDVAMGYVSTVTLAHRRCLTWERYTVQHAVLDLRTGARELDTPITITGSESLALFAKAHTSMSLAFTLSGYLCKD